MRALPSLQSPMLDAGGRLTQPWVGFFTSLTRAPGALVLLDPAVSPFAYTAPEPGFAALTGGIGVTLALIRGRETVALDPTGGMVPLAQGDTLRVGFTTPPAVTFVPRGP